MRDWNKLRVFEQADELVMSIYAESKTWPSDQRFSLTNQIQRAAVSVASNIVEGSSRASEREYLRFIEIAYSSSCEVEYQLSVASRLEFQSASRLRGCARILSRSLNELMKALSEARSPKPEASERSEDSP